MLKVCRGDLMPLVADFDGSVRVHKGEWPKRASLSHVHPPRLAEGRVAPSEPDRQAFGDNPGPPRTVGDAWLWLW